MMGLGILYFLAISDKSFHTEREIELALKLPVLTMVPLLEGLASPDRRAERASLVPHGFAKGA
jgi:hypothetical protein